MVSMRQADERREPYPLSNHLSGISLTQLLPGERHLRVRGNALAHLAPVRQKNSFSIPQY